MRTGSHPVPVLFGHLLNLAYTIVDTLFLSMLGKDSTAIISGMGLVFPVYMLVIALGTGIFAGTGSFVGMVLQESVFQVRVISFSFVGVLGLLVSNAMFQATGKAMPGLNLNCFRMGILILPFFTIWLQLCSIAVFSACSLLL